jgi:hypoxanthine phosphoribosyltransferase
MTQVYRFDGNIFDLNHSRLLIIDDVVTTGTTICAIIKAVLDEFPFAEIEVFCLAWTPTLNQQEYIISQHEVDNMMLNEPMSEYRIAIKQTWIDMDFEKGETNVSVCE